MISVFTPRGRELLEKSNNLENYYSDLADLKLTREKQEKENLASNKRTMTFIYYAFSIFFLLLTLSSLYSKSWIDTMGGLLMILLTYPPVREKYLDSTPLKSGFVTSSIIMFLLITITLL
jgi:hypothetical protein